MIQLFKDKLPPYVVINDPSSLNKEVLRTPTPPISFPLDEENREIIRQLEKKFDGEENCGGLAAPQIGYSKRIIILAADDEELKKYRDDFTDMLPKSIWINPSFKPVSKKKTTDWEACFSVDGLAGEVPRFTEITYEAWTPEGEKVTGRAKGFLARLIQHEIDHLNGVLFIDHVPEDELVSR
ncbi:MAG: peptide deformylase [Alphaproteobacteria bacterium]|nr:peptide deformylase [Alphaproteobacteria bacterium]